MNCINEVGRRTLSITNKIVTAGEKIKLSISKISIMVKNTINEFIHPNCYENKIIFNAKSKYLKSEILIVSNKEKANVDNKTREYNFTDNEQEILKKRQQILKDIELPNGDLIPIDEAINTIYLCKQDSILKSKLSLIDYITDMQFKSSKKSRFDLSNKLDKKINIANLNNINEGDYIKLDGYDNKLNDGYLIMTGLKGSNKNMSDEVKSHINENEIFHKKEDFKSYLIEITKNTSLLDRLSDGNNSFGYEFIAKVANFLEDYNKNKEQEKTDSFNKETYLKKLANSNYFFKLNKKVNNIIYLQYLKEKQRAYENSIVEKDAIITNNTLNESKKVKEVDRKKKFFSEHERLNKDNMSIIEKQHNNKLTFINNDNSFDEVLAEIDNQLNIANKNKHLTLKELLEKVKK